MFKIASIEVVRIAIPFHMTFSHALASRDESESLVVVVHDDMGRAGYGESAPRQYVTGETLDTAQHAIETGLSQPFLHATFATFDQLVGALGESQQELPRHEHAAFCALELALLDLGGKVFGHSAGEVLGTVTSPQVRYSGVVSADDVDHALKLCTACKQGGVSSVKLKVGQSLEIDQAILKGARRILGDKVSLRVDANGAWSLDQAVHWLESCRRFDIAGVEQPLPADDLAGLARLTKLNLAPVIVDESLVSHADAEALIAAKACHIFNIRVSKNGGLLGARRLRETALANGLDWMLGAQVGETAILSAAGRHLGSRGAPPRWAEGSFGTLLLKEDLAEEDISFGPGGRAPAIEGHGLGVTIDEGRLARWRQEDAAMNKPA